MFKTLLLTLLLLGGGSGIAAYSQLQGGHTATRIPQAVTQYAAAGTSKILDLMFADKSQATTRPRIAQLPQTKGVNTRGNTSLAERRLQATASAMVDAVPTARAKRDAGRNASRERWWSKFNRKAPEAQAQGGRLTALQARAREEATKKARLQEMVKKLRKQ